MSLQIRFKRLNLDANEFTKPLVTALFMLFRARQYARDAAMNPWHFAVEMEEFYRLGVTKSEVRWLILKGLAIHAQEAFSQQQNARLFKKLPTHRVPNDACLIATDALASLIVCKDAEVGRLTDAGGIRFSGFSIESRDESERETQSIQPDWDHHKRELRYEGQLVKKFRVSAPNQERILCAFQEEGWPSHIDDPLPPEPGLDCHNRLKDTIKYLNRHQINTLLEFRGDGTGCGVLWARRSKVL